MWIESEDFHVKKIVEFIARIPEHLDLHFSYFSTMFYTFLKFTEILFLSSCNIYSLNPRIKFLNYKMSLDPCTHTES